MLQYERFHHLNASESKLIEKSPDIHQTSKGDGPIEIPHIVHYSAVIVRPDPDLHDIEA